MEYNLPVRRALLRPMTLVSYLVVAALAFWVPFRAIRLGSANGPSLELDSVWGLTLGVLERRPVSHAPQMPDAFGGAFSPRGEYFAPDPAYAAYLMRLSAWQASQGPVERRRFLVFDYARFPALRGPPGSQYAVGVWRQITVPYYLVVIACLALPALQAARAVRAARVRNRARDGRCPQCGYDLRATPERCPECGLRIGPAPHVPA